MAGRLDGLIGTAGVLLFLLLLLPMGMGRTVLADSSRRTSQPDKKTAQPADYEKGMDLVEAGDYDKARRAFERAAGKAPRDPDVLNMLAYSQRKTGQLDRAIETYKKALGLRPKFPQAREYLAEAYLQASLRELEILKGYGNDAETQRAQLIQALKSAASDLPPPSEASAKPGW